MYSEWVSLATTISSNTCGAQSQSVLNKFREVAVSVVKQLASNLGITQNAEPSHLVKDEEVIWCMDVICFGLSLPLQEHETIKDCVNVYCEWMTALHPNPKISVPKPITEDPNIYSRKMINHFHNLFVPRQGESADIINRQAVLCHRVLRTLQQTAQISQIMDRETWEALLLFLLAINEILLAPPTVKDDVSDQLCERVLSVLFEVWLLASVRCFPSPSLWKTLQESCLNWRHRIALVEQWNRVNLALTARLLEFTYGSVFPELKIRSSGMTNFLFNSSSGMTNDCIGQTWYRFLRTIGSPATLCLPQIISKTPHFVQWSISRENGVGVESFQHPCLLLLPQIFLKAIKGISSQVGAFLGFAKLTLSKKKEIRKSITENRSEISELIGRNIIDLLSDDSSEGEADAINRMFSSKSKEFDEKKSKISENTEINSIDTENIDNKLVLNDSEITHCSIYEKNNGQPLETSDSEMVMERLEITENIVLTNSENIFNRQLIADDIDKLSYKVSNLDIKSPKKLLIVTAEQDTIENTEIILTDSQRKSEINNGHLNMKTQINNSILTLSSANTTPAKNIEIQNAGDLSGNEEDVIVITDTKGEEENITEYEKHVSDIRQSGQTNLYSTLSNTLADRVKAFLHDLENIPQENLYENRSEEKNQQYDEENKTVLSKSDESIANDSIPNESIEIPETSIEHEISVDDIEKDANYPIIGQESQTLEDNSPLIQTEKSSIKESSTPPSNSNNISDSSDCDEQISISDIRQSGQTNLYSTLSNTRADRVEAFLHDLEKNPQENLYENRSEEKNQQYDEENKTVLSKSDESIANDSIPNESIEIPETSIEHEISVDDIEKDANYPIIGQESQTLEDNSPLIQTEKSSIKESSTPPSNSNNISDSSDCDEQISLSAKINIKIHFSQPKIMVTEQDSCKSNESIVISSNTPNIKPQPTSSSKTTKQSTSSGNSIRESEYYEENQNKNLIVEKIVTNNIDNDAALLDDVDDQAKEILTKLYGNAWKTPQIIKKLDRKTNSPANSPGVQKSSGKKKNQSNKEINDKTKSPVNQSRTRNDTIADFSMFHKNIRCDLESTRLKSPIKSTIDSKRPLTDRKQKLVKNVEKKCQTVKATGRHIKRINYARKLSSSDSSDDDLNYDNKCFGSSSDDNYIRSSSPSSSENEGFKKPIRKPRKKKNNENQLIYMDLSTDVVKIVDETIRRSPQKSSETNDKLKDILKSCTLDEKKKIPATPKNTKRKLFTPQFATEEEIILYNSPIIQQFKESDEVQLRIPLPAKFAPPLNKPLESINDDQLKTYGFLQSLDVCVAKTLCHPDAIIYREKFWQTKDELTDKLYKLFNENIFDNKLNVPIIWNKKLQNTAGRCCNRQKGKNIRSSTVELSEKVLTSGDRLRCTLIHELCHAATWIFSGENGHGAIWKSWAKKSNKVFPELPVIGVCHNNDIEYKYTYKCIICSAKSNAHSRSKKVENIRCSYCHGSIEILLNKKNKDGIIVSTPVKGATGFAKFVKEKYKLYKKPNINHGEVMKLLGAEFTGLSVEEKSKF